MSLGDWRRMLGAALVAGTVAGTCAPPARAEHAVSLTAGPELRARSRSPDGGEVTPRYELAIPHGLISASGQTALVARLGMVLPGTGAPLAFPATVGLRYAPFETRVRPVLGADIGGYLVVARGPRRNDSPGGPEWCWSMRSLVGVALSLAPAVALLVYADAMWAQMPRDERSRDYVFSNIGGGVEVRISFAPRQRLVDMLLLGTAAPKGF